MPILLLILAPSNDGQSQAPASEGSGAPVHLPGHNRYVYPGGGTKS